MLSVLLTWAFQFCFGCCSRGQMLVRSYDEAELGLLTPHILCAALNCHFPGRRRAMQLEPLYLSCQYSHQRLKTCNQPFLWLQEGCAWISSAEICLQCITLEDDMLLIRMNHFTAAAGSMCWKLLLSAFENKTARLSYNYWACPRQDVLAGIANTWRDKLHFMILLASWLCRFYLSCSKPLQVLTHTYQASTSSSSPVWQCPMIQLHCSGLVHDEAEFFLFPPLPDPPEAQPVLSPPTHSPDSLNAKRGDVILAELILSTWTNKHFRC